MRTPHTTVPPLRDEVTARKLAGRVVAEDPLRRVRVPLDALAVRVMQALADGPRMPQALTEALGEPRYEIWQRVRLLNAHLLLATPRAAAQCALAIAAPAPLSPASAATAPLRFPRGLGHACVASGGCCHGTDVGPLKPDDIAKVRAIDWSPHLPADVTPEDWLIETPGPAGELVTLLGMRHGRCVFLDADKLCVIHKVAGPAQKPTICRQFPFTFTRTADGVDVSYSTECRAWDRARAQAGVPSAADRAAEEEAARRYLAEGGPLLALPSPVPLWAGVDLAPSEWEALRDAMVVGVTAARDHAELVLALVGPVRDRLAAEHDGCAEDERFASRAAWSLPEADGTSQDAVERFFASSRAVAARVDEGFAAIAADQRRGARPEEADRTERLRALFVDLFSGRTVEDLERAPEELDLWRDLALASLASHEPARRDMLLFGVAQLVLRLLAGRLLAALLAQTSLRARTSAQDVVDSMVLLTKIPRGSAFSSVLAGLRRELCELLVDNAEVFARGTAPRMPHPWLELR